MTDPKLYQTHDGTWVFEHDNTVMFLTTNNTWDQYQTEEHGEPADPLETLEGWLRIQPSETITGTERTNLIQDIEAAANELRQLRNTLQELTGEPQ